MLGAPLLAAGPTLPFLGELVALFFAGALIAYLCHRVHLLPIAGFLVTGALVGPDALGLVEDQELIDMLAEVGVILLLFTIGLEFSLAHLARIGRDIFVGGGVQVGVTVALVAGLGAAFGVGGAVGVYTGCLVALSSTAIVLGLLSDRAEMDTPLGRLSLAVLIFQDLAIIVMVLLVPILAGGGESTASVLWALAQAVALVVGVVLLARKVVPPVLGWIAATRQQEIFLLAVVAICFGTAWLTSLVGVSLALGAFLAGLVVSESHYSERALSEILPFRTVFNAVFFVSVGMLLDVGFVLDHPLLILGVAGAVLLIKSLVTAGSVLLLGYPVRVAAGTALTLSQIGEFSFVLERAGRAAGLSPAGLGAMGEQVFIAVTVLLMLATPFLVKAGPAVGEWLQGTALGRVNAGRAALAPDGEERAPLEDHVVIVGYGPAGRHLANVLAQRDIPFVVVEMNPQSVHELREDGSKEGGDARRVVHGDASRPHILEAAGIERAKLCAVVINDARAARRITQQARHENPTLQLVVRTRFVAEVDRLHRAGADAVVPEELEATVRVFSHVLGAYLIPQGEIERHERALRADDYQLLRRPDLGSDIGEAHQMVLEGLTEEGLHIRTVAVRPGAPAEGQTLQELALRRRHEVTVLTVRRGQETISAPAGDFRVEADDRLVLLGTATHFEACAGLFRASEPAVEDDDAQA